MSAHIILRRLTAPLVAAVLLLGAGVPTPAGWLFGPAVAAAQGSEADAKQAFDAAKELGTVEAWDSFLNHYPTGIYADLARAYVKKLAATPAASAPAAVAASSGPIDLATLAEATLLPCAMIGQFGSMRSDEPARLVLSNGSGVPRGVFEIGAANKLKKIASLAPGEQLVLDTFLTHPWMVADATDSCSQIFMPGPGTTLGKVKSDTAVTIVPSTRVIVTPQSTPKPVVKALPKPSPAVVQKRAAKSCTELGLAYRNGQCVAKAQKDIQQYKVQKKIGCPAGTYLNPLGVCQPDQTGG